MDKLLISTVLSDEEVTLFRTIGIDAYISFDISRPTIFLSNNGYIEVIGNVAIRFNKPYENPHYIILTSKYNEYPKVGDLGGISILHDFEGAWNNVEREISLMDDKTFANILLDDDLIVKKIEVFGFCINGMLSDLEYSILDESDNIHVDVNSAEYIAFTTDKDQVVILQSISNGFLIFYGKSESKKYVDSFANLYDDKIVLQNSI